MRLRFQIFVAAFLLSPFATAQERPVVALEPAPESEIAVIGPAGGEITHRTADGTAYRLAIPPRALAANVEFSIRPVRSAKDLPGRSQFGAGVTFEPKGLHFIRDATLTITPARPFPRDRLPMMWLFEGAGERPWPAAFRQDGGSFVRPIAHFSGAMVVGEDLRFVGTPDFERAYQQAVKDAADAADAAMVVDSASEERASRRRALEEQARYAKAIAEGAACARAGRSDCGGNIHQIGMRLAEEQNRGVVGPKLRALGRTGATCEEAKAVLQEVFSYQRDWMVHLGDQAPRIPLEQPIEAEVDGQRVPMDVISRMIQLCRKKAVEDCKTHGVVESLSTNLLSGERQRQLLGQNPSTDAEFLAMVLEHVACVDPMIERCFASGDFHPAKTLGDLLDFYLARTTDERGAPSFAALRAARDRIEEMLPRCARYRVVWTEDIKETWRHMRNSAEEGERYVVVTADLAYQPRASGEDGGRVTGEGAADFQRCTVRLSGVTSQTSSSLVAPCVPVRPASLELRNMQLTRAARPGSVELIINAPLAETRWRHCWRNSGCKVDNRFIASHALMNIHTAGTPAYKVSGSSVSFGSLRQPLGDSYPVLFEGTIPTRASDQNRDVVATTDIRIEHIGRR